MTLIPELQEYAARLSAAGFRVYVHDGAGPAKFFLYSQEVDGKACFGNVQISHFGEVEHFMPIKPSRENGSNMFVEGVPNELTVETARKIAQPRNYNRLVGTQTNWQDAAWLGRGYVELTRGV